MRLRLDASLKRSLQKRNSNKRSAGLKMREGLPRRDAWLRRSGSLKRDA